jgi:hypothetical protein
VRGASAHQIRLPRCNSRRGRDPERVAEHEQVRRSARRRARVDPRVVCSHRQHAPVARGLPRAAGTQAHRIGTEQVSSEHVEIIFSEVEGWLGIQRLFDQEQPDAINSLHTHYMSLDTSMFQSSNTGDLHLEVFKPMVMLGCRAAPQQQ